MPVGTVTGLSSGIEWGDTLDLIMQIERRPVDLLEQRRSNYQVQLTNWSAIETRLKALQDQAEKLDSINEFLKKSGSSSDTDVLTVTAGASAAPSSHEVIVNQLATNSVLAHETGWADLNTTAVNTSGGDLSFSYDYGGTAVTVTVPDGTTLQGLVNLINRDVNNAGITASVVSDGQGGGSDYHLVLTGNDTGAGNDVTIIDTVGNPTDIGPTGTEFDAAVWDATRTAQNAQIKVDGIPDVGWGFSWIESESNTIADVIPGVTLNLKNDSGGNPIMVEIALDQTGIEANVGALVQKFNEVMDAINLATRYDPESEVTGPLSGNSMARSIRTALMQMIGSNIPGTDSSDTYRSLGQVGLKLTSGGKLTLDKTALEDALEDDPTGVARLFAFDSVSSSSYLNVTGHGDNTVGGTYAFEVTYNASGNIDPGGTNTIGGYNAIIHSSKLLGGANGTGLEGLLMTFTDPGNGPDSITSSVQIYTGLSALLFNTIQDMVNSDGGTLTLNRDSINDSIDNLDERIAAWERRLDMIEETYRREFTAMETLVSQLKTQGNYLSQAF